MYSWYRQGYLTGTLRASQYKTAQKIISMSNWVDGELVIEGNNPIEEDDFMTRYVEGKFNTLFTPPQVSLLSHKIINHPTFRQLHKSMVNPMYEQSFWLKELRLVDFAAWCAKEPQPWHTDYGPFDIQVLMYFTDDDSKGGELSIGNIDHRGDVKEVYRHIPIDGSFVILQANNPYHQHKVHPSEGDRKVIELRYKVV
jgi:hypothetical protein